MTLINIFYSLNYENINSVIIIKITTNICGFYYCSFKQKIKLEYKIFVSSSNKVLYI